MHHAEHPKLRPEPTRLPVVDDDLGPILKGPFDNRLKARLKDCIKAFSDFCATGVPAMPYIAAWRKNSPGIWYEYTSPEFRTLFECTSQNAAQVFRDRVLDRRIYNRPAASGIHAESLAFHQLQDAREQLRHQSQSSGRIEALYKVRTPCGKEIWLKDQAVIEAHEPDGIFLSLGYLTMASKEVQARDEIRQDRDLLETLVQERTTILKAINRSLLHEIKLSNQTQAALDESQKRLALALEAANDGIWELDLKMQRAYFSPRWFTMLGYPPDAFSHTYDSWMTLVHPEDRPLVEATVRDHVHTGKDLSMRFRMKAKNGLWRWIYCRGNAVERDSAGRAVRIMGIHSDITALKQAESEKQLLESQLRQAQKMEAIGTLAGGIAHDFNNLLMGIQGTVSLMELDTGLRHASAEHLKSISRCVQNGAHLTKQLLGFARKGRYEIKPIDINELIQKTSSFFGRTRKEITIHTHLEKHIWAVEADQSQIEQVLINCYVNAWQAMPAGGQLYLKTENRMIPPGGSGTRTNASGRYVRVTIQDNGLGMDPESLERIFEPFFTTKEIGIGTGLGLASAYGIVKNHSGFIDVTSQKGKGSVFHIYLPATLKPLCEPILAPEKPVSGSATILLVDDEQIILDTLQAMLRKLRYRVITACSGPDALAIFREKGRDIDLVMLDLIMPGMGGDAIFDGLKQQQADVKILLFSGYDAKANIADILDRGGSGFIQKPFSLAALSRTIQKILHPDSAHGPRYSQ